MDIKQPQKRSGHKTTTVLYCMTVLILLDQEHYNYFYFMTSVTAQVNNIFINDSLSQI